MLKLKVGSSVSNEHAMSGSIYVYPEVYSAFYERNKGKTPVYVRVQRVDDDKGRSGVFCLE